MPLLRLLWVSWFVLGSGCIIDRDPEAPEVDDSQAAVEGNGDLASEPRTSESFTRVEQRSLTRVEIMVDATLDQSTTRVVCDRNLLPFISTLVHEDRLQVWSSVPLIPTAPCKVLVELPKLVELETRGDGALEARGDIRELERITASQYSDTEVRGLDLDSLEVEVRETSSVMLSGAARNLRIVSSSRRDVHARDLSAERAEIVSTGTGLVSVRATEGVVGELNGDGNIEVFGEPAERDIRQSGNGKVLLR
jgi:hypothetical protein